MPEGDTIHYAANRIRVGLVGEEIEEIATPHPRMTGKWGVYRRGQRWRRSPRRAWLVIRTLEHEVVELDGPVLELMTDSRTRFDQRIAAGIGNIWKCESCFLAGIDPRRKVGELSDEEALSIVREARPLMRESALKSIRAHSAEPSACGEGGRITTAPGGKWGVWVHERAGLACRRCGTLIRGRGKGDDNRTTFWCPSCQA